MGFGISIARQMAVDEDTDAVNADYQMLMRDAGIPDTTNIVAFPDFLTPEETAQVPFITEDCMTRYQTEQTRAAFMCASSKMLIKKDGQMRVYACTLVDNDPDYDQGQDLEQAIQTRAMLKHHRCFSCFKYGSSCSEA